MGVMKIRTKFFGEIEIADEQLILFPYGVYGFEDSKRFVLLHDKDYEEENETMLRFLQCADDEHLCFTVIDPEHVEKGYSPKLPESSLKNLGSFGEGDLGYLAIAVIRENLWESTANMQGPIVINARNRLGAQVILEASEPENAGYQIRHKIFAVCEDELVKEGATAVC